MNTARNAVRKSVRWVKENNAQLLASGASAQIVMPTVDTDAITADASTYVAGVIVILLFFAGPTLAKKVLGVFKSAMGK